MTVYEIYQLLLLEFNKSEQGGEFSPKEFNQVLNAENISFFNRKSDTTIKTGVLTGDTLSMNFMRNLVVTESLTPSTGVIDLSSSGLANTYGHWESMITSDLYNNQYQRIEFISRDEFNKRNNSLKLIKYNPVAVIDGDTLTIYPTNITGVNFSYYKIPETPYMDCYVDSDYNLVFMPFAMSATITGLGATYLRTGATTGVIDSVTKELGFPEAYHEEFLNGLLGRLGLRERDQYASQYSEMKKQQE